MTADTHTSPHRIRRRPVLIGLGVILIALVAFAGWLAYTANSAQTALTATRDAAQQAKNALLEGNVDAAREAAARAAAAAAQAQDDTTSIPFTVAKAVPYLGDPLDTVAELTTVVRGLADTVLVPVADAGSGISPKSLVAGAGRVDLAPLRTAQPILEQASAAARTLADKAGEVPESPFVNQINDAREQLQTQTRDLSGLLTNTSIASRLLPAMLGGDGPRNYFLAFQTNAEARGTGGLLGGFGIINADNGAVTVQKLGANTELPATATPIDLGPQYNALWGPRNTTTDFRNSNASPNFPYAGQIWASMWQQRTGQRLDGTIATDPIALSYILAATGPVSLADGESISADNVVQTTLSTAYARFGDNQTARKQYLQDIAAAVVSKVTSAAGANPQGLADALGRAASEGRLAVWSANPDEQKTIADTRIGSALPQEKGPFASVIVNNAGGNKLDYYLLRELSYTGTDCSGDTRTTTVKATLTNTVDPTGLTPYVASTFRTDVPYGTNESIVYLYAAVGSKITKVTSNGLPAFTVQSGVELGHPVTAVYVTTPPGKTSTVEYTVSEPTAPGDPNFPVQPLVDTPKVTVDVPTCK